MERGNRMAIKKFFKSLAIIIFFSSFYFPLTVQGLTLPEVTSQKIAALDNSAKKDGSKTSEKKLVRVAMLNMPNFLSIKQNGSYTGLIYDYFMAIEQITDLKFEFIPMSFPKATEALKNGYIDLLPGIAKNPERLKNFYYSEKPICTNYSLFCELPESKRFVLDDYSAFSQVSIGVVKGFSSIQVCKDFFSKKVIHIRMVEYNSDEELKNALERHEIDCMLISSLSAEKKYKIIDVLETLDSFIAYSKKSKDGEYFKKTIDEAILGLDKKMAYFGPRLVLENYKNITYTLRISREELNYINSTDYITLAMAYDMFPLQSMNRKTKVPEGFSIEYIDLISKKTGLKFNYVQWTDKETLKKQFEEGKVQGVVSIPNDYNTAKAYNLCLSPPYLESDIAVISKNDVNYNDYFTNTDILDLKTAKVALIKDNTIFPAIIKNHNKTKISFYPSIVECIDQVSSGKADFTIIDYFTAENITKEAKYSRLKIKIIPNEGQTFSIGLYKNTNPHLISIISKAVCEKCQV